MKKSLTYLPEKIQEKLARIVERLREKTPAEMIILFGSYARGDYVIKDIREEDHHKTIYESDFDILLIIPDDSKVKPLDMESNLSSYFVNTNQNVSVIVHSYEEAKERFERGNYFFYDIQREGRVLYDSKRFKLPKKRTDVSNQERYEWAKEYFDEYLENAKDFFEHYRHALVSTKNWRNRIPAFMLHQATEMTYNMLYLVFTDYKPKIHDLKTLRRRTGSFKKGLREIFPLNTKEERELFKLFCTFYINSRYRRDFAVDKKTLEFLAEGVAKLQVLAEEACIEKMNSYLETETPVKVRQKK